jgi:hypothetical protein
VKLNYFMKRLSTVGQRLATTLVCVAAIALVWQGAFFSNTKALADSTPQLIATSGADQIKEAADKVSEGSKKIIRGTENKVKETANTNAAKVDQADDDGGIAESKAMRDKNRIERRAEEDADRTEKRAEKSMDAVKNAVDNIKDAFSK